MRLVTPSLFVFVFVALYAFPTSIHAQISGCGSECEANLADAKCFAGIGGDVSAQYGNIQPIKEGDICRTTPLPESQAHECKDIGEPVAVSRCEKGKCVAKETCKRPLSGLPDVPVDTGGSGSSGGSAGSGGSSGGSGTGSGSGGTLPSGNDPLGSFDPPSTTPPPTGSGSSGSGGVGTTNPDGSIQLPDVPIVQNPGTIPSGSGTPAPNTGGSTPKPVWNPGAGGDNSWLYPGSTFVPGGTGASLNPVAQSLFTSVFSHFVGNLFGNLFNGRTSGGVTVSQPNPTLPTTALPSPRPAPVLTDHTNVTLDRLMGKPIDPLDYALPRDVNGFPIAPSQSTDRTGLGTNWLGESLTGPRPEPATDEGNPTYIPRPNSSLDDAVRLSTSQLADASGNVTPQVLRHPEWWTPEMVARYSNSVRSGFADGEAYQRARSETIATGLAGLYARTTAPGSTEGQALRRLLEEDVRIARQTRDRAYLESSFGFFTETMDKLFGYTAEQRALNAANERLSLLGELEARYGLAGQAGGTPQPSVEILVTNQPVAFDERNAVNLFEIPGILATRGLERIRSWWTGPSAVAEVPTPSTPPVGTPTTPSVPSAGEQPVPTMPPPQPAEPTISTPPEPSTFLERLSAVANRVRSAVGFPAQPPATETPADPAPPSPDTPASAPSSGNRSLTRIGMGLVDAFIRGLSALLSPAGSNSTPAPTPTPTTPVTTAAAITANPNEVEEGEATQLSWSSIGAGSCAVVDALLNVIARGTMGATTSPALSETTRFGIICDVQGGGDKFLNEVQVRVAGSASSTPPLFSNSGRASTASGASSAGSSFGGTSGTSQGGNPTPIDVRTCDPEQDINSFIRCLCEAEPNPAGCAIPPGGV